MVNPQLPQRIPQIDLFFYLLYLGIHLQTRSQCTFRCSSWVSQLTLSPWLSYGFLYFQPWCLNLCCQSLSVDSAFSLEIFQKWWGVRRVETVWSAWWLLLTCRRERESSLKLIDFGISFIFIIWRLSNMTNFQKHHCLQSFSFTVFKAALPTPPLLIRGVLFSPTNNLLIVYSRCYCLNWASTNKASSSATLILNCIIDSLTS